MQDTIMPTLLNRYQEFLVYFQEDLIMVSVMAESPVSGFLDW
jgi:hypothetical protein